MKKNNEQTLKQAIEELLETYKLNDKLDEVRLINSWEKVVGKMVAKHTTNLYIQKKNLFIVLDNAALKNELSYAKQKIIDLLNQEAKKEIVDKVIFR